MTNALMKAIFTYRAAWNAYLAATFDDDDAPLAYEPALAALESWSTAAEDWQEALMALELASEFYEVGDSDVIPAMMKAVIGWFNAEAERRAGA